MNTFARSLWIKVCGMTDHDSIDAAIAAGVDAIGFVFAPSARRVSMARATELARPARGRVACVAVTLHPSVAEVAEIIADFAPDILQSDFHDIENLQLPSSIAVLPVLRSGAVLPLVLPQRVLFEGPRSGVGERADWSTAAMLARQTQVVLAGGLHCDNVADAVAAVVPYGVDVSSGVESTRGHKNPAMILSFVKAARAARIGDS
jgi:phosphoribosylanthranilate isomerase